MPSEIVDQWKDARTWIAIVGSCVGICGFFLAILSHKRAVKDSRLTALTKVLQPLLRCKQSLFVANNYRRTAEQLKISFPNPKPESEAVQRVNEAIEKYTELIKSAEVDFRSAESEFGASQFRFPDAITKALRKLIKEASELGRLVNDGFSDKADLQLARCKDESKQLMRVARGWRLYDPFEAIRKYFSKSNETPKQDEKFELTDDEMQTVIELMQKRVTSQAHCAFVVHPPKIILDDPSLIKSENALERLSNSVFTVVFEDGHFKLLSLPQLMALVHNLIVYQKEASELNAMISAVRPQGERRYEIAHSFSMSEIMQPTMVSVLLSKIEFAKTPSD